MEIDPRAAGLVAQSQRYEHLGESAASSPSRIYRPTGAGHHLTDLDEVVTTRRRPAGRTLASSR